MGRFYLAFININSFNNNFYSGNCKCFSLIMGYLKVAVIIVQCKTN